MFNKNFITLNIMQLVKDLSYLITLYLPKNVVDRFDLVNKVDIVPNSYWSNLLLKYFNTLTKVNSYQTYINASFMVNQFINYFIEFWDCFWQFYNNDKDITTVLMRLELYIIDKELDIAYKQLELCQVVSTTMVENMGFLNTNIKVVLLKDLGSITIEPTDNRMFKTIYNVINDIIHIYNLTLDIDFTDDFVSLNQIKTISHTVGNVYKIQI